MYSFGKPPDGAYPVAGLIADTLGALYGTTTAGGIRNYGTVFKLTPSGSGYTESVLYRFRGYPKDGRIPHEGRLLPDEHGAFYGTTEAGGGKDVGVVFKLTRSGSGYAESIMYSFLGYPNDGAYAIPGLIAGKNGVLYGVTVAGGGKNYGTVYALTPSKTGYSESVLHSFRGSPDDGRFVAGGLLADKESALYGTTGAGGPSNGGTVFKLTPGGSGYTEQVLFSFNGSTGIDPIGTLFADEKGALYGMTQGGGPSCSPCGTVFKLAP